MISPGKESVFEMPLIGQLNYTKARGRRSTIRRDEVRRAVPTANLTYFFLTVANLVYHSMDKLTNVKIDFNKIKMKNLN